MKKTLVILVILSARLAVGQTPEMFDVSDVTVGTQRLHTKWLFAMGRWSDAGKNVGAYSTEIHCYKRFGFCEVSSATVSDGVGSLDLALGEFDILRWDAQELIAVDSSGVCVVNTLRADFKTKKVSISSTSKGVTDDKTCRDADADPAALRTAFLTGSKDILSGMKQLGKGAK
jgi:hypothetical protein